MEFQRQLINTEREVGRLLERLDGQPDVGFDTESSGPLLVGLRGKRSMVNVYRSTLSGLSLSAPDGTSAYIPLSHREANAPLSVLEPLQRFLAAYSGNLWIHNAKHELLALSRPPFPKGYWTRGMLGGHRNWLCTQVGMWFVGKASSTGTYGLKALAPEYLGMELASFDDTTGGFDFSQLKPKDGLDYACQDSEAALLLGTDHVMPGLMAMGDKPFEWFLNVEMPFVAVLRAMTDNGMRVDQDRHRALIEELRADEERLLARWELLSDGINPNSGQQLQRLYEGGVWDPKGVPTNKNGVSTQAEHIRWQLARCAEGSLGHRLATTKLEYAALRKLTGTYGLKLLDMQGQYPDQRLHGSFLHTGTATGRLSSSYPNLQNIPKRTELGKRIRKSFVPREGYRFVSADYSQIELRLMAHFAGEGRLLDGYRKGVDVHQETADMLSELLGMEFSRDQGKTGNFMPIYGAGPKRAAQTLSLSLLHARRFLKAHEKAHHEAHAALDRMRDAGRERGWVRTFSGRKRAIASRHWQGVMDSLRAEGKTYQNSEEYRDAWYSLGKEDRRARNTPIQGGAADVVKLAMVRVARELGIDNLVCQIHDDLMLEVPEEIAKNVSLELQDTMEGVGEHFGLRVPLVAEPSVGSDWSEV